MHSAKFLRCSAFPIEDQNGRGRFSPMVDGSLIQSVPAFLADVSLTHHDDIVAAFLIAMVAAVFCTIFIMRTVVRRELVNRSAEQDPFAEPHLSASVFTPPGRWLAVRSHNPREIECALGVQHARICSWGDAIAAPFEPRLFISPPVNGWIVVMGCDLPDPADDIDECFKFLIGLSYRLGEVQFYVRNRAVAHHAWARLERGKVMRAYAWAGETLWNQGSMTRAERDLHVRCLDYTQGSEIFGLTEREALTANTDKVLRLAAAWSIDPTSVEGSTLEAKGIAGDLLHSKPH